MEWPIPIHSCQRNHDNQYSAYSNLTNKCRFGVKGDKTSINQESTWIKLCIQINVVINVAVTIQPMNSIRIVVSQLKIVRKRCILESNRAYMFFMNGSTKQKRICQLFNLIQKIQYQTINSYLCVFYCFNSLPCRSLSFLSYVSLALPKTRPCKFGIF